MSESALHQPRTCVSKCAKAHQSKTGLYGVCTGMATSLQCPISFQIMRRRCIYTQLLICQEITPDEPPDNIPMDDTASFPDNHDNFINNSNDIVDPHNAMDTSDFEHTNFQQFLGVNE
jgi:hypothetical protein